MNDLTFDLIREHCNIHIGAKLSTRQVEILLAAYDNGTGISLSRMSSLLRLPLAAVRGTVETLSRLRVRRSTGSQGSQEFGLIRTEPSSQTSDAVQVRLTKEGHTFTQDMLRAITG